VNNSSSLFWPLLIIAVGMGYLLHNLGFVAVTPWQILHTYWPALIILHGLRKIADFSRPKGHHPRDGGELVTAVLLVLFGAYLLAPRIGLPVIPISWNVVWPIIIILIGISLLFDKERVVKIQVNGDHRDGAAPRAASSLVGEIRRGSTSWVLDDTFIRHGIGSVTLDLTQAIIPEREVIIDISGLLGESVIYLPPDLPVKADCQIKAGDITVLDQSDSGIQRRISYISPGYHEAVRRLDIRVRWKAGDIKIRRIG
jgi:lia operon protein LiaF